MHTITILGATGSIGESTLDVVNRHPDQYRVFAVTGHRRISELVDAAGQCSARYLVVADPKDYKTALALCAEKGVNSEVLAGSEALEQVASDPQVDSVMAAIVGAAGLLPTLAAVKAGKRVLLANKESLVMSGELFMQAVKTHDAELLPIDSEHNAIFQSLPYDFVPGKLAESGVSKILLTGSGGPFRETDISTLKDVTPEQACAHPNWDMGKKISVDSATMMNKGLEFIEACWLFGVGPDDIEVVLHPQSIIHSMVQYADGSVLAQLGNPDMRTPIAHALAYPERIGAGVKPLNFADMQDFTFSRPDFNRYPNLRLAIDACRAGQWATTSLNAANEVAVDAFLGGKIRFTQIADVNAAVLDAAEAVELSSVPLVLETDRLARQLAEQYIVKVS